MSVNELNKEELRELKERHLYENNNNVSYQDLAVADLIISDDEIKKEYEGIFFVKEDFWCNV